MYSYKIRINRFAFLCLAILTLSIRVVRLKVTALFL